MKFLTSNMFACAPVTYRNAHDFDRRATHCAAFDMASDKRIN